MADHGSSGSHAHGFDEHRSTYNAFVKGSIILAIHCFYILVALVAFRFVPSWNVFLGFSGLVVGTLLLLIDARMGNKYYLSGGFLAVFALITAIAVS